MDKVQRHLLRAQFDRRRLLGGAAATAAAISFPRLADAQSAQTGVDPDTWTPEYINSIAGTEEYDTAAELNAIVPLDYSGRLTYWWVGPTEASSQIDKDANDAFWAAFSELYPNIEVEYQNLDYNSLTDQFRTAALGNAGPMVVKLPILNGVEFASKGQFMEFGPADVGYAVEDFWPGAMKSVTWDGKTYGIPTNNETMALIWNAGIFEEAGLDPETPPATWDELVQFSKQIHDSTGKSGYGLVARTNAGNTPFRFMPKAWAYGGGTLDEAEDSPTYEQIYINNDGTKAAVQVMYDMYVRDKSVPTSALTNTQTQNQDPFIAGQLAMVISHPSEYSVMLDRAAQAEGSEKEIADAVVANMRYGYLPEGPVRRAVVFGGSNVFPVNPDIVDGGTDLDAVRAFIAFSTSPEWTTRLHWVSSNPGNLRGFRTSWMKERLESIPNLDVTTSMLPYGIPFPVVPESNDIMLGIVPDMLQNALTETMSVDEACEDAASKIEALYSGM